MDFRDKLAEDVIKPWVVINLKEYMPDVEKYMSGEKSFDVSKLMDLQKVTTYWLKKQLPDDVRTDLEHIQDLTKNLVYSYSTNEEIDKASTRFITENLRPMYLKFKGATSDMETNNMMDHMRTYLLVHPEKDMTDLEAIQHLEQSAGIRGGGFKSLLTNVVAKKIFMFFLMKFQMYIVAKYIAGPASGLAVKLLMGLLVIVVFTVMMKFFQSQKLQEPEPELIVNEASIFVLQQKHMKKQNINYVLQQIVLNMQSGVPEIIKLVNTSLTLFQSKDVGEIFGLLENLTKVLYSPSTIEKTIIRAYIPEPPVGDMTEGYSLQMQAWNELNRLGVLNLDFGDIKSRISAYYEAYILDPSYKTDLDAYKLSVESATNPNIRKQMKAHFLRKHPKGMYLFSMPFLEPEKYLTNILNFHVNIKKLMIILNKIQQSKLHEFLSITPEMVLTMTADISAKNVMLVYNAIFVLYQMLEFANSDLGKLYLKSLQSELASTSILPHLTTINANLPAYLIVNVSGLLDRFGELFEIFTHFKKKLDVLDEEFMQVKYQMSDSQWTFSDDTFMSPSNLMTFRVIFQNWNDVSNHKRELITDFLLNLYEFTLPFSPAKAKQIAVINEKFDAIPAPGFMPGDSGYNYTGAPFNMDRLADTYDPSVLSDDDDHALLMQLQNAMTEDTPGKIAKAKRLVLAIKMRHPGRESFNTILKKADINPENNLWAFVREIRKKISVDMIKILKQRGSWGAQKITYGTHIGLVQIPRLLEYAEMDLNAPKFVIYNTKRNLVLQLDKANKNIVRLVPTTGLDHTDANNLWFFSKDNHHIFNASNNRSLYVTWVRTYPYAYVGTKTFLPYEYNKLRFSPHPIGKPPDGFKGLLYSYGAARKVNAKQNDSDPTTYKKDESNEFKLYVELNGGPENYVMSSKVSDKAYPLTSSWTIRYATTIDKTPLPQYYAPGSEPISVSSPPPSPVHLPIPSPPPTPLHTPSPTPLLPSPLPSPLLPSPLPSPLLPSPLPSPLLPSPLPTPLHTPSPTPPLPSPLPTPLLPSPLPTPLLPSPLPTPLLPLPLPLPTPLLPLPLPLVVHSQEFMLKNKKTGCYLSQENRGKGSHLGTSSTSNKYTGSYTFTADDQNRLYAKIAGEQFLIYRDSGNWGGWYPYISSDNLNTIAQKSDKIYKLFESGIGEYNIGQDPINEEGEYLYVDDSCAAGKVDVMPHHNILTYNNNHENDEYKWIKEPVDDAPEEIDGGAYSANSIDATGVLVFGGCLFGSSAGLGVTLILGLFVIIIMLLTGLIHKQSHYQMNIKGQKINYVDPTFISMS